MEEKVTIEQMFGPNVREQMLEIRIKEFVDNEQTNKLFNELLELINNTQISNKEIVEIVSNLPYNIAYAVLKSVKRDVEDLIGIYQEMIFQDFLKDARDISKRGVSSFERRFLTQPSSVEKILKSRMLTRYELELLFGKIKKYSHLKGLSYEEMRFYDGEDKLLCQLSAANAVLTNPKQSKARNKMFNKVKDILLSETIKRFTEIDCNINI